MKICENDISKNRGAEIKLLYLMHIDWDWIFQRPQILSLKLSVFYKVKTVYRYSLFGRKLLQLKSQRPIWFGRYLKLPKYYKYTIIRIINKIIEAYCIFRDDPNSFDIIWLCYPTLYNYIPKQFTGLVVYDCMDNHSSMIGNEYCKRELIEHEISLVKRADLIFASSETLYNQIREITPQLEKVILLRNGFSGKIWSDMSSSIAVKKEYKIGYIGTVAEWFDFELLKNSLINNEFISYYIIGPCSNTPIPKCDRFIFLGTIEHEKLYDTVKDYDCIIMPFILNNTTQAVDPVKLYEYISFGKCIISIYYDEIDRFKDFVYFYHNQEEYNKIIQDKCQDGFAPKYTKDQQEKFLKQNTWDERCEILIEVISNKINSAF